MKVTETDERMFMNKVTVTDESVAMNFRRGREHF